jgi:hypothetical protein
MVTRSLTGVSITALLLVMILRPSASHQLALDFLACAGAFMVVLALFLTTRGKDLLERQ